MSGATNQLRKKRKTSHQRAEHKTFPSFYKDVHEVNLLVIFKKNSFGSFGLRGILGRSFFNDALFVEGAASFAV